MEPTTLNNVVSPITTLDAEPPQEVACTTPPPPAFSGVPDLPPESWLWKAFCYSKERSQLPDPAVFWTLMHFCGAALRDTIYVDWAVKPIFPNLPMMIVGPSGVGKTGAMNVVEPLFERFLPQKVAEESTAEGMTKEFATLPTYRTAYGNSCGYWVIPELADVFGRKDYQQGSIARVTRLLDAPKDRRVSRSTSQSVQIPGHCILNWLAGSTPQWLRDHVDDAAGAGGFLPRLLVYNMEEDIKYIPNPKKDLEAIKHLNSELINLLPLGGWGVGQERIDLDACGWEPTARGIYDDIITAKGTLAAPFIRRRAENVLRIWLIISKFGQIRVNSGEFGLAVKCAKWLETHAVSLCKTIQIREFGFTLTRVFGYLERKQSSTFANLCKNLDLTAKDLNLVLLDLKDQGLVIWDGTSKGNTGVIRIMPNANKPV